MNRLCAKSSICKSTAKEGSEGAQGKSPLAINCPAGSVQVHKEIDSISVVNKDLISAILPKISYLLSK